MRSAIFPGEDGRVLRVARKIIRGLSHYHGVGTAVADHQVWADILRYRVPEEVIADMNYHHREADVAEYWFTVPDDVPPIHSAWLLNFFGRTKFIGAVTALEEGFQQIT